MAVKIRLTRLGKKKQPTYRLVVIDSRKQRDGKYIEQLGFYDPRQDPSVVEINNERALYWLHTGAQPTERAQKLLEISGAWTQFRVAKGDIHTIGGDDEQPAPAPKAAVAEEAVAVVEDVAVAEDDEVVEPEAEAEVEETVEVVEADETVEAVEPEVAETVEVDAVVEEEEEEEADSSEES
jgi:small subunit ribosomal protein S16